MYLQTMYTAKPYWYTCMRHYCLELRTQQIVQNISVHENKDTLSGMVLYKNRTIVVVTYGEHIGHVSVTLAQLVRVAYMALLHHLNTKHLLLLIFLKQYIKH